MDYEKIAEIRYQTDSFIVATVSTTRNTYIDVFERPEIEAEAEARSMTVEAVIASRSVLWMDLVYHYGDDADEETEVEKWVEHYRAALTSEPSSNVQNIT